MEGVYAKVRSGEVVSEMPSAVTRACNVLEVTAFAGDLDRDVGNTGGNTLGLLKGAAARIWFHRFCMLRDVLVPAVVAPGRDNFLALMGWRFRLLDFTDSQKREILLWAPDFRSALAQGRTPWPRFGRGTWRRRPPRVRSLVCLEWALY